MKPARKTLTEYHSGLSLRSSARSLTITSSLTGFTDPGLMGISCSQVQLDS